MEIWTDRQILKARQMHRKGATLEEVIRELGTRLTEAGARKRLLQLGLRFGRRTTIHAGNSVLMRGAEYEREAS